MNSIVRDWMGRRNARLYWVLAPLVLLIVAAAVATCGGGAGERGTNAVGDREGRTTTPAPSGRPSRGERLVSALRRGGHVIYFRHTATDWGQDDEDPVVFSDCGTQRNLSSEGRRQARAIGDAIERLDIPVGGVLSSPYCRAIDTARLAFGRVRPDAGLENLASASDAEREARTNRLRRLLSVRPGGETNRVLSGHGYNIQAVVDGTGSQEGDAEIFRPGRGNRLALVATVTPAEWGELAERFGGDG
jgi:phosphohistidine phosphatase SixA